MTVRQAEIFCEKINEACAALDAACDCMVDEEGWGNIDCANCVLHEDEDYDCIFNLMTRLQYSKTRIQEELYK